MMNSVCISREPREASAFSCRGTQCSWDHLYILPDFPHPKPREGPSVAWGGSANPGAPELFKGSELTQGWDRGLQPRRGYTQGSIPAGCASPQRERMSTLMFGLVAIFSTTHWLQAFLWFAKFL